jgi:hypothetical protein
VLIASYNYKIDPDICGGSDLYGQPYEFSDGVGAISRYAAEKFAKSLHLGQFVPSCFQVQKCFVLLFIALLFSVSI